MDKEIREFYNAVVDLVNYSPVCVEAKRMVLLLAAEKCENIADRLIRESLTEETTITEKGEMEDGTINTGFTGVDEVSQCSKE